MRKQALVWIITTALLCGVARVPSAHAETAAGAIVVVAQVKVKPGTEDAFKEAASRIVEPTRAEAGNLSYEFYQSLTEPTDFTTYEQWRSQADLDRHMQSAHMTLFFQQVGGDFVAGYPQIQSFPRPN
jgi:quinol monooxygenase YgiN